ncbi:hypothetical protein MKW92_011504, partial [Papaver armeniacum]
MCHHLDSMSIEFSGHNGAASSLSGSLCQMTQISLDNNDMELLGNDHEEKDHWTSFIL